MANVKVSAMSFPYSLGKIFPGASYATVSVPLTQNITPTEENGDPSYQAREILIQALPGNGGYIYICNSAAAPDLTGYTNVVGILDGGVAWSRESSPFPAIHSLSKLYVGATNATDAVIASFSL